MRLQTLYCAAITVAVSIGAGAQTPSGIDVNALDKSVSPCANFYQYACGTWIKSHPLPGDKARFTRFNELADRNDQILKKILEDSSKAGASRTAHEQKIGDYYAACMDEGAIEKRGVAALKPELGRIARLKSPDDVVLELARLHREGVRALFVLRPAADQKDSAMTIAEVRQGGLGMPDRDYYLKDDAASAKIRQQYRDHVRKMFELLAAGLAELDNGAGAKADAVMAIETKLATSSMDRVELRNPDNTYHKMTIEELARLSPKFAWKQYFSRMGTPPFQSLNVSQPEFVRGVNSVLADTSIDDLKTYLMWRYLDASLNAEGRAAVASPVLPAAFDQENWNFNSHILNGVKEQAPRWKRCADSVDRYFGDALGQEYVKVAFSPASKERTLQMVGEIEKEMEKIIQQADWMSGATKDQAFTKLHMVANKIGYPEKWKDYAKVKVSRDDAFGDVQRARADALATDLAKIGKPVDKNEWGMTPPTVNAYYSPNENNINFPAGILQPPFYGAGVIDPVNYGGIGAVIGHELTHGFDDQGRRFDGRGNRRDWWTPEDGKNFEARADCIVQEYGGFSPAPGVTLNGKLTLGENAADNGGLRLAYMAMMDHLAGHPLTKVDGFTPQQQFFLGFAQLWCGTGTQESAAARAKTDPHSPGEFRVNGTLRNMAEFGTAFGCEAGTPMTPAKSCRVW